MENWLAEIMTDPMRDEKLHVELEEGGLYRARLYQDDSGKLQLRIYGEDGPTIPVEWLLGIIQRFREDLEATERP